MNRVDPQRETRFFHPDAGVIANLRNQIQTIERGSGSCGSAVSNNVILPKVISLGAPEINHALPWNGLPANGLHEVFGDTAALGFSAVLLSRFSHLKSGGPVLWCHREDTLCGQGLQAFGINPDRVIQVRGKNDTDILWAMEEGLQTPGLAAIIGAPRKIPPIAGRRLQLAAEEHGVAGILLRLTSRYGDQHVGFQATTSAALTRWRVTSAPSVTPAFGVGLGPPQWHLELQRYRLSAAQNKREGLDFYRLHDWQVEWCDETDDLSVVNTFCDRPAEPFLFSRAAI